MWSIVDGVLYGADDEVAAFVAAKIGSAVPPPYHAIGCVRRGRIAAGCVFFAYRSGADVEIATATEGFDAALFRQFMRRALAHPFDQFGMRRVTAEIAGDNRRCIRLAEAAGFRLDGIKRGTGAHIYGLTKEDWQTWASNPTHRHRPTLTPSARLNRPPIPTPRSPTPTSAI